MTHDARDRLTGVRRRLPDVRLATPGGGEASLRPRGRAAPLVLLLHGAGCSGCQAYASAVAARQPEIAEWDGRVIAVLAEAAAGEPGPGWRSLPFPVLYDPEARVASVLDVASPAVVVADQWGEIHDVVPAGDDHRFPAPDELVEWARFLAIQCPECEGEAL